MFVLTALSAALMFLVVALLVVTALRGPTQRFSRILIVATGVPFGLQIITYLGQDSRQVESHAFGDLLRELLYALQIVVPSGLRHGVDSAPSPLGAILIIVFWLSLICFLMYAVQRLKSKFPRQATAIVMLSLAGVVFLVVSVYFNGNLNHQYLIVPFGSLWSALAIASTLLIRRPRTRHVGQIITFIAIGFFSFSASPLVGKDLRDPFFVQPHIGDWSLTLRDAREQCDNVSDGYVHPEGTSDTFMLPCRAID